MIPPRASAFPSSHSSGVAAALLSPPAGPRASRCRRTTARYEGAVLFTERCSGCHTLTPAGTQGTANRSQRTQGPNLDQRTETYDDVIFAIRNGGFSGAIMPQNIVVGDDAEKVAQFVSQYAGGDVRRSATARANSRAPAAGRRSHA